MNYSVNSTSLQTMFVTGIQTRSRRVQEKTWSGKDLRTLARKEGDNFPKKIVAIKAKSIIYLNIF